MPDWGNVDDEKNRISKSEEKGIERETVTETEKATNNKKRRRKLKQEKKELVVAAVTKREY